MCLRSLFFVGLYSSLHSRQRDRFCLRDSRRRGRDALENRKNNVTNWLGTMYIQVFSFGNLVKHFNFPRNIYNKENILIIHV